jgi:hypothetical protein
MVRVNPGTGQTFRALPERIARKSESDDTDTAAGTFSMSAWDSSPWSGATVVFLTGHTAVGAVPGIFLNLDDSAVGPPAVGFETTATAGVNNGRAYMGGASGASNRGVLADGYWDAPGIPFPADRIQYNYSAGANPGHRQFVAVEYKVHPLFAETVETEIALPIRVQHGIHVQPAVETDSQVFVLGTPGTPLHTDVVLLHEQDTAIPISWVQTDRALFQLSDPDLPTPAAFNQMLLRVYALKTQPLMQGDIRIALYDGTTLIQQGPWTPLVDDPGEAVELILDDIVADRTNLRAGWEIRTSSFVTVRVTDVELQCAEGFARATEIDSAQPIIPLTAHGTDILPGPVELAP